MTRTAIRIALAAALVVAGTNSLFAQKAKPLQLTVTQVNDRRTNGHFPGLTIGVELQGIATGDVAASRVLISKAVDDSGRDLVDRENGEPKLEANQSLAFQSAEGLKEPASLNVQLLSPDRGAAKISEVSGEIELFMPTKDPNSVALLPKVLGSKGKALTHKALKANGVEITVLSEKQFEAEKKKIADKKRADAVAEGWEGESLEQLVTNFLSMFFTPSENDIMLKVKDPKGRVQQITFVDASGKQKQGMMRDEEGMTVLSTWEPPEADWGLKVSMKTPKNVVKQPFVLTSVALP